MTIKIHITKEILEKSMYCGVDIDKPISKNCAVSLAIRDMFPDAAVNYNRIFFNAKDAKLYFSKAALQEDSSVILSFDTLRWIKTFDWTPVDKRLKLPPFSFEIDIHDSVIDKIGIEEVEKILSKSLTMEKV